MAPLESLSTVSYSSSVVTMVLTCIILEIKLLVNNRDFLYLLAFVAPVRGSRRNIVMFGTEKTRMVGYPKVKK